MATNPVEYQRIKRREFKQRLRQFIIAQKDKPCIDCGGKFPPYVMQFDHLPQFDKIEDIGKMVTNVRPRKVILEEIKKCELVCSNCHAVRTEMRRRQKYPI